MLFGVRKYSFLGKVFRMGNFPRLSVPNVFAEFVRHHKMLELFLFYIILKGNSDCCFLSKPIVTISKKES